MRYAIIANIKRETLLSYLPSNYGIVGPAGRASQVIGGDDNAGWTLEDYVLPRLASGLYFGRVMNQYDAEDSKIIDRAIMGSTHYGD